MTRTEELRRMAFRLDMERQQKYIMENKKELARLVKQMKRDRAKVQRMRALVRFSCACREKMHEIQKYLKMWDKFFSRIFANSNNRAA